MNVKGKLKDHIGVAESVLCSERLCDISLDYSIYVDYYFIYFLGSLVVQLLFFRFQNKQQKMDPSCNKHIFVVDVRNFCGY